MPSAIRVPDETLAAAIRPLAGERVDVVVAPVPELDDLFAELLAVAGAALPSATVESSAE